MLQEMLTISHFLISGTTFMRILSFRPRSLSRTTWTVTFKMQKIFLFSKIILINLLDPKQTVFSTVAILGGLD